PGAQAVDRVGVPDPADVEAVADPPEQLVARDGLAAFHDDIGGRDAGLRVEVAPAAATEAEAVARHQRRLRRGAVAAELLAQRRIAQQPLTVVPGRQGPP